MGTALLESMETNIDELESEDATISDWDPAEDIETKEAVIAIIDISLEENDPAFLLSSDGSRRRYRYGIPGTSGGRIV